MTVKTKHTRPARYLWLIAGGVVLLSLVLPPGVSSGERQTDRSANPLAYEAASVFAKPNLTCLLYVRGTSPSQGFELETSYDGYARFWAVPMKPGQADQWLSLSCKNSAKKKFLYTVNLASNSTFVPHPFVAAKAPGKDRPPLVGNPMKYSQLQLIERGYGVRPDPRTQTSSYAEWLKAARTNAHILDQKVPDEFSHNDWTEPGGIWAGTELAGSPTYEFIAGWFSMPTAVPGGEKTTETASSIWDGITGSPTALIQSGIEMQTTPAYATYTAWREYCCGDSDSNGYGGGFSPNPGDEIYAQNWYCSANGAVDLTGGYGCSYLDDETSGELLTCTLAHGSPCWSVKANSNWTFGKTAEFIDENQSSQLLPSNTYHAFTDFSPAVTFTGGALLQDQNSRDVGDDPSLLILTDSSHQSSHVVVSTTSDQSTLFTMEASESSFPLYCRGPLITSGAQTPTPTTDFKWAAEGADAQPPSSGQCAWADRPPRGSEIRTGDSGEIFGYLNQFANLASGKYLELEVYRDPKFANELNVTSIVGYVTPPL